MKKFAALIILGLMFLSIAFGRVLPAISAPTDIANDLSAVSAVANVHDLTAADVETFLDGIVPLQLDREDIAGATVAVVKDGKPLFTKGYGYADVKHKQPVTAETLFRPGSVSKLFTWTAVMQLVEQGKLDLCKDVNEYLDFKIPAAFGQPISLKNILTHTAGFEEQLKELFTADKSSPNLGNFLKTHTPKRIFAPGTTPAYSNYGAALAGYVVERVSGQPFNDYIHQNIFKPLGMIHSTFAQPLPPELVPLMSNGYMLASDEPKEFETVGAFPAGSLTSSAADMSKFMLTLEWRLRWAVRIVFALNLFFIVTLFGFLLFASKRLELFSDSGNIWIWLIQSIGVLGAVGSIVVFYNAIYVWTSERSQIWGKLQATMFALACLGVLWLVFAGHLLSFNSNY